ncbi:MAG: endonuclease/exonuclease/phosphatase family protein [Caldilinea sp.]|nr:endonuclease/exonuclease/phosphatase family protein [Caldilineaceae bacterium]MCB9118969.1 endonuclease/exonuclease/phosphatase family protein [Caldilineaceae bacterium]MCB9125681.1 endonuclease/exonuclease/phosphatase family protein [Caldilineaceae bacterium]MCO5214292.1 endonuclease/exonuclease/phosphatase family protein [Caldilinea sp.]
MRIVTYNIHGWRTADGKPNLDGVAETLQATVGDIIGLNEVYYPRVIAGDSRPALEALAQRLGMHFVFGPCLRWPAEQNMPADAYGNALLSRWPIIASSAHHLTSKEEDKEAVLAGKEQRGLLEGRILLPDGQTFTVYVTHLDHTSETARMVQLRIARTWLVRDRNRPHLVMGDFNAVSRWEWPDEKLEELRDRPTRQGGNLAGDGSGPQVVAAMEKAGYVDLYRTLGEPGAVTFPTDDWRIRIDYLFASQALAPAVTNCAIWTAADGVSDHRPVLADLVDGSYSPQFAVP